MGLTSVSSRDIGKQREPGLTRVTKEEGHAEEEMASSGHFRDLDREVYDEDDEAADCGRRWVPDISLACVTFGVLLFEICIGFSLPLRELR